MKIQLKTDLFLEKNNPSFGDAFYSNDENANMFEKQYAYIIQKEAILEVTGEPCYSFNFINMKAFAKKDCYTVNMGDEKYSQKIIVKLKDEDFVTL